MRPKFYVLVALTLVIQLCLVVTAQTSAQTERTVILAIGDSLMEGNTFWGGGNDGNTVQGGWVTRLAQRLETVLQPHATQ